MFFAVGLILIAIGGAGVIDRRTKKSDWVLLAIGATCAAIGV